MSYRTEGVISVHPWGQGLSKGRRGLGGMAGGLEQGGWGLGRVSKGLGDWGLMGTKGQGWGVGAGALVD